MDTLIDEVELLAKEKEAEAQGGTAPDSVALNGDVDSGWEVIGQGVDEQSTIVRDIPVLPNKR